MISFALVINSTNGLPCFILHVESSLIIKGMPNVEWAVLPPGMRREVIPLDAIVITISPFDLNEDDNIFHKKVLPVQPYPYKKNTPP